MLISTCKIFLTCLAAFLALGVSSPLQAQEFQVPMSEQFAEEEIVFDRGLGPVYNYRWTIMAHEGQLAICAVGYLRDNRLRSTIRDMARRGQIRVESQIMDVDLRFFARAPTRGALSTTAATCRPVAPLPNGNVRVGLRFGSGMWRN